MKDLIAHHLRIIVDEFYSTLIPKPHISTHYPTIISKMGLVSHFSPIRYQSKHQKLKFINSTLKSYINFCQTLTGPHQKSFASIYSQIDLKQIIIVGKSLKSNIPKTDEYFDFLEIKYIPYYRKEYWILCKEIELLFDEEK